MTGTCGAGVDKRRVDSRPWTVECPSSDFYLSAFIYTLSGGTQCESHFYAVLPLENLKNQFYILCRFTTKIALFDCLPCLAALCKILKISGINNSLETCRLFSQRTTIFTFSYLEKFSIEIILWNKKWG